MFLKTTIFDPNPATELRYSIEKLLRTKLPPIYYLFSCFWVHYTIKHFCANNQESNRHHVDAVVSERALREIYLKGYEIAVKEGGARSITGGFFREEGTFWGQEGKRDCGDGSETVSYTHLDVYKRQTILNTRRWGLRSWKDSANSLRAAAPQEGNGQRQLSKNLQLSLIHI